MQASDDIGVSRMQLLRSVNGWGPMTAEIGLDSIENQLRAEGRYVFDLATLGALPGDTIQYQALVYDNRPEPANVGETDFYTIEVISLEEYVEYMRMKVGVDQIQDEMNSLSNEIESIELRKIELAEQIEKLNKKLEDGEIDETAYREALAEMTKLMDELEKQMEALAEKLQRRAEQPELYDFEAPLHQQMKRIASQLKTEAKKNRGLKDELKQAIDSGQDLQTLTVQSKLIAQALKKMQPVGEKSLFKKEDMEKLVAAAELAGAAERLRYAILQQRDLADRLAAYKHRSSLTPTEQLRVSQMGVEQARLKAETAKVQKQLEELGEKHRDLLPKMSSGARNLAKALKNLDVERSQHTAAELASAGRARFAHQAAESAAVKLESLMSECQAQSNSNGPQDMDGCLTIPKEQWAKNMQQLTAGLKPSLGVGGSGGSGAGSYGSMASMTMQGPRQYSQGHGDAQNSQRFGQGTGNRAPHRRTSRCDGCQRRVSTS